jgi:predicted anti-sigma-YlaC factor YlaD
MICEEVEPNLLDYSKGLLTGAQSQRIKAHLDDCEECRAVLEGERSFALRLEALPIEEPVNDVWALVRAQTKPRVILPLAWLSAVRHVSSGLRRAVAATALGATIAVTIYSVVLVTPPASRVDQTAQASVTVKWSDDPVGNQTDAMVDLVSKM